MHKRTPLNPPAGTPDRSWARGNARRLGSGILLAGLALATWFLISSPAGAGDRKAECDWTAYGRDLGHSFNARTGCSSITPANAAKLQEKWMLRTRDVVTASPAVVDGTVYVGSWDGTFYAVDAESGEVRWTYKVRDKDRVVYGIILSSAAVAKFPGYRDSRLHRVVLFGGGSTLHALNAATGKLLAKIDLDPRLPHKRDQSSIFELESSPAVADIRVPIGSTWRRSGCEVTRRGQTDSQRAPGRITNVERRIFIGLTQHTEGPGLSGLISLCLRQHGNGKWELEPIWKFDPERKRVYKGEAGLTQGHDRGFACGGVWSSPAVDRQLGLVYFGTENCRRSEEAYPPPQDDGQDRHGARANWSESMFAIKALSGKFRWKFQPAAEYRSYERRQWEASVDDDFGASPNVIQLPDGRTVVGEGRKSGDYYARSAATGAEAWRTQAGVPGRFWRDFSAGGFLGTTAVDRHRDGTAARIVGATAFPVALEQRVVDIRDFGDLDPARVIGGVDPPTIEEGEVDAGSIVVNPRTGGEEPVETSPQSVDKATWAARAMDASSGQVVWKYRLAGPSFAATSIANGVAFVPNTFSATIVALRSETGEELWRQPLIGPSASSAAIVGDSIYVGAGLRATDIDFKIRRGLEEAGLLPEEVQRTLGQGGIVPGAIYRFALE